METALNKDINKQYIEAINLYEADINSSKLPSVDSFINLAFIYWGLATDELEFIETIDISGEWGVLGVKKYVEILDKGLLKYPNNIELHFWEQYLPYRLYMTEFSERDCVELFNKYGDGERLVPYFFLHLFDKEKYKDVIVKLLDVCNDKPTAKKNYIKSFLSK